MEWSLGVNRHGYTQTQRYLFSLVTPDDRNHRPEQVEAALRRSGGVAEREAAVARAYRAACGSGQ